MGYFETSVVERRYIYNNVYSLTQNIYHYGFYITGTRIRI